MATHRLATSEGLDDSAIVDEFTVEENNELSGWEIAAVAVGVIAVLCSGFVLHRVWKKNSSVLHSFRFSRNSSSAQTGEFDNIGLMMSASSTPTLTLTLTQP